MAWTDDATLLVYFGFGSGVFAASPSFTDVASDVRSVTITRGRSSTLAFDTPGVASIVLDNSGGEYDPNNSTATHAGNLELGTPVKIVARVPAAPLNPEYEVFYGYVTRWPLQFTEPNESVAVVEAMDGIAFLSSYHYDEQAFSQQDTDARIDDILDDVGWPAAARNLSSGVSIVGAETFTGSALQAIQQATEAEQGRFFVARDGDATFYNRVHWSAAVKSEDWGGSGGRPYADIRVDYDADYLLNQAAVTGGTGDTQVRTDTTSIAQYGPFGQIGTINNPSILNEAYALNVAQWLVAKNKDVRVRVSELTYYPEVVKDATATAFNNLIDQELGQIGNVEYTPPTGDDIDQDVRYEQIRHEIEPMLWKTTLMCHPVSTIEDNQFWVLGTGELGDTTGATNTRLA